MIKEIMRVKRNPHTHLLYEYGWVDGVILVETIHEYLDELSSLAKIKCSHLDVIYDTDEDFMVYMLTPSQMEFMRERLMEIDSNLE